MTMTNETEFNPGFSMDGAGGGGGKSFDREKIKGLSYYRIAPPYGTNNNRQLFKRYQRHWGFTGENGQMLPVACSYPTERFCPVCQLVHDKEAELKRVMGDKKKIDDLPEDLRAVAKALDEFIYKFRVEQSFAYNAITVDNRPVVLELKWTPHKNLWGDDKEFEGRIKEAVKKFKFDPTSLRTGVWFQFDKSGKGLNTMYPVDFKKTIKILDGQQAEVQDRTPLPEELVLKIEEQLKAAGPNGVATGPLTDIHTLMDPMTAAQLSAIMNGAPIPRRGNQTSAAAPAAFEPPANAPEDDIDDRKMQGAPAVQAAATPAPAPMPTPNIILPTASTPPPTASTVPAVSFSAPAATTTQPPAAGGGGLVAEIQRLRDLQAKSKSRQAAAAAPAAAPAAAVASATA